MRSLAATGVSQPRRLGWLAVLAVALMGVGITSWWLATTTPAHAPVPEPMAVHYAGAPLQPKPDICATATTTTGGEFTPTRIAFPVLGESATVIALPRDAHNVPGTPPLSQTGKNLVAWDQPPGIKPGAENGNVLLNAHTWPDGSALGNRLLDQLHPGDRILVRGTNRLECYQVTQRIEVAAREGYPAYYDTAGPHQLALLVCSGRRVGPNNWTHRTIWFASPVR